MKKFLSTLLSSAILVSSIGTPVFATEKKEIVIIYTNDTHCQVDGDLGFADISALEAIEKENGNEVIIVDAGDAVQGGSIGSISKGSYIIDIMNEVGYDLSALGNHEFDYGIERLKELSEMANYPYICANLISLEENKPMYDQYKIISIGDTDIAFIGITTPNTFTSTAPEYFKNAEGEFIYDFSGGDSFYSIIQQTIDAAENDGADIVIAVTHLGADEADYPYMSKELISNTDGFDAVIDAHSHSVIESDLHKDKNGNDVILTSTGSKFDNIGAMRIFSDNDIETDLIDENYREDIPFTTTQKAQIAYNKTNNFIDGIKSEYNAELEKIVATSEYDLTVNDPAKFDEETGVYRLVRRGETNLGDFCADAYRAVLNCDVAIINGGGVRADINKGDVSYGDVLNVNPFGNDLCIIEVTGKQILCALEHGARSYPAEEGAFLQVSGLTYEIDSSVKSPVVLDDKGMFKELSGNPRVKNVKIAGNAIDENTLYTLGGSAFTLINGGDGFTMFKNSRVINNSVCSDCDALVQYITEDLGGTIDKQYENPYGDGRIKITEVSDLEDKFTDIDNHQYESSINEAVKLGFIEGTSASAFDPDAPITRGMFATILYRMENSPETSGGIKFDDVSETAYYSNAASWAAENKIMIGVGDNRFEPDDFITNEQTVVTLLRYCENKSVSLEGLSLKFDNNSYENLSDWAKAAILALGVDFVKADNEPSAANPQANTTRAEVADAVMQIHKLLSEK